METSMSIFSTKPASVESTKTSNFDFLNLLIKLIVRQEQRKRQRPMMKNWLCVVMCCWHCNLIVFILWVARILRHLITVVNETQYLCNIFEIFLQYVCSHTPPDDCFCQCNAIFLQCTCISFEIMLQFICILLRHVTAVVNVTQYFAIFLKYSCNNFAYIPRKVTTVVIVTQFFCCWKQVKLD